MIDLAVSPKIMLLDDLAAKLRWDRQVESQTPWPTIVQAHGCFDVFHVGHVRHLRQAKDMGDILVVTVTADEYIRKGSNRPQFMAMLRMEVLAALECVDYVSVVDSTNAVVAIEAIRPNIYVKGPECEKRKTDGLLQEIEAIQAIDGEVRYTDGCIWSSSEILKKLGM